MFKFKQEKDKELMLQLKPVFLSLLYGCVIPLVKQDYPEYVMTITRTIDDKIPGESVSNTHAEGRAVDIRIFDMEEGQAKHIAHVLNLNLSEPFGAISLSDKVRRFAVLEVDHIHFNIGHVPDDTILKLINYSLFNRYGTM